MEYAYKVKTLYDGTDRAPMEQRILLIRQGVVEDTTPWAAENDLVGRGYQVLDYSDYHAMPGMIDSHVHTILPGDGTAAEDHLSQRTPGEVLLGAARNIQIALHSGVTTLRDCGALPEIVFDLRRAVESGVVVGPDLVLCGSSLTVTGGHTYFFDGEVDTPQETVHKIRQLSKQGADFIKLIATGGGTKHVIQHAQMLSNEQMRAASEEAHRLEKMTTAHVCTTDTARAAVESGVDMLEHLIWADEHNNLKLDMALAEEIARKGIPVCHTMSVLPTSIQSYKNLGRPLTPAEQEQYDMLRRFRDTIFEGFRLTCRDIRYIPGTDAGWRKSAFDSLVDGIVPMAELGLSNLEALHSATGLAATALGRDGTIGTLTPGRQGNFILLEQAPIESLQNLRTLKAVFKKGEYIV